MKKIDLGVFGLAVATNVRRFRGDTSYAELSRRLEEVGRPIPPLGLRHLEAGNRRVDVDDLFALGMALDVAPLALLLPEPGGRYTAHEASAIFVSGPQVLRPLPIPEDEHPVAKSFREFATRFATLTDEQQQALMKEMFTHGNG
jgi:hypothetical protein